MITSTKKQNTTVKVEIDNFCLNDSDIDFLASILMDSINEKERGEVHEKNDNTN